MASACAAISTATSSPDPLLWPSPRLSFSRDFSGTDDPESDMSRHEPASDFEFHLHEPPSVITADELFSNGKLVTQTLTGSGSPKHVSEPDSPPADPDPDQPAAVSSSSSDLLAPSPRAPMCTSRWKDLLRLKRAKAVPVPSKKAGSNPNPNPRPLRFLLKKNTIPKCPTESSMNSPLLPSCLDHEESASHPPKIRLVRPVPLEDMGSGTTDLDSVRHNRAPVQQGPVRTGASIDSPRLNAAGKVVFTGLERSSSSPGSFAGGPRVKYRGIERSYSANVNGVRIAPVLNVPVCSLRGSRKSVSVFGFERIFKGDRRERNGSAPSSSSMSRAGTGVNSNNKGKIEAEEK